MPQQAIYRDNQVVFLNSSKLKGVQNIEFNYSVNSSISQALGVESNNFTVDGAQVGQISISSLIVGADPFISLTGESPTNIYLLRDKNNTALNYAGMTGYLTSYKASCSIDQVPQYQASFQVFGDMGKISTLTPGNDFLNIQNSSEPAFQPISFKDVTLTLNGFNVQRVMSYDLDITIDRRPDFILNSSNPRRVSTNYPITVTFSFNISAEDYEAFNMKNFPVNKRQTNIGLSVKSGDEIVNTYSFSNMILVAESYSSQTDPKSSVTLTYRCYINKLTSLITDSLFLYLNASHPKSPTGAQFRDLTFNKRHFDIGSTVFSNGYLTFNGSQYIQSLTSHTTPTDFTLTFVYRITTGTIPPQYIFYWGPIKFKVFEDSSMMSLDLNGNSNLFLINSDIDQWHYITITFDSVNNLLALYVNGTLSEVLGGITDNITPSANSIYLGYDGSTNYFYGDLGKIIIYTRVLTSAEIAQNYAAIYLPGQS